MPPLPAVPNVLRVDWQFQVGSDLNVDSKNFFRYSGPAPDSAACVTFAADIYALQAALANWMDTSVSLVGTKVTDLSSSAGGVGVHAQSTVGTEAGTIGPGSLCALVNYIVGRRYRGGKPRNYFPFGNAGNLNSPQAWNPGFISGVDSELATYFGGVIGLTVGSTTITQHVNVSYYSGFTSVQNPVTHRWRNVPNVRSVPLVDNILSFAVSGRPGSQRRRN